MLRVLVAEDSATARMLIVSLLSSDPEITVVGQAKNGAEAVALHQQLKPDVITMDIQMPVLDGIEATRQIVARSATPVIMVSSLDPADVAKSMLAFNAGALAVLAKPSGPGTPRFEKDCRELIATVKALSEGAAAEPPQPAPEPPRSVEAEAKRVRGPRTQSSRTVPIEIIGIVGSTGGPIALRAFFKALPQSCKAPIVIVQHIASGFVTAFASWLKAASGRSVEVAVDRQPVASGVVYVAPDDRHVQIVDGTLVLSEQPLEPRPSGTLMLASLAKAYGAAAAGVVLTGTGTDGVEGLLDIANAGGATYGQDEASSTSFETPRAALAAGAIGEPLAVPEIAHRIANLVAGQPELHKH